MEEKMTLIVFAIVIFAISVIAGRLPFMIRDRKTVKLHKLITFSSGIMLGVLFIMLMPEALERAVENGEEFKSVAYMMFAGFLLLFIIDFLVKKFLSKDSCDSCEACSHDMTSLSAFVGLSIHSFFDGLALAAAFIAGEDVGIMVLIALCLHKSVVVFSLASTMLMSHHKRQTWAYILLFSIISPLASVISYFLLDTGGMGTAGLALCFSVGIFAFVTMCDMLPEAFHHNKTDMRQMAVFLLGIVIVIIVSAISGAMMGDIEI